VVLACMSPLPALNCSITPMMSVGGTGALDKPVRKYICSSVNCVSGERISPDVGCADEIPFKGVVDGPGGGEGSRAVSGWLLIAPFLRIVGWVKGGELFTNVGVSSKPVGSK
jgi:hypothetical protein